MGETAHVLLLPGLLNDARLFAAQRAVLAERAELRVVETDKADSVEAIAAHALAQAPSSFALVGFSMGGYVAFEMLRQAPDRIDRLALIDTSARPDTPDLRRRREQMLAQVAICQFRGVTNRLLPQLVHPSRLQDRPLIDVLQAMALAVGKDGFVRQQRAILDRPDSRSLLAGIDVPTLVLCGAQDQLTPPALSREIAQGVAGATLVEIAQCGHVAPLERPEQVNASLLEWLAVKQ